MLDRSSTLLLDQRGDQITITEEVVKAAPGNEGRGKEVMTLLLDRYSEMITTLITEKIFVAAAACGQDRVLDLLLQHNNLITAQRKWRQIAKFYNAAKSGDVCCIEQFLHEGTKPDTKNIRGRMPPWIAAANGHDKVVKVLARRDDVDVNSTLIFGVSPLFWPSSDGKERIVHILMEASANPQLEDEDGDTAITMARRSGFERLAKVLERSGENRIA